MSEPRSPLERIVSHPVAAAVNLGGNLVVVAAPVVAVIVLLAGYLSDNVDSALAAGLAISMAVTAYLWLKVRGIEARIVAPGTVHVAAGVSPDQIGVLREVTAHVVESFERFEYDNLHGASSAGVAARAAASVASARAGEVEDQTARFAVYTYLDLLARTRSGWREASRGGSGGATASEMDELRSAQEEAVMALGRSLRGGS